MSSQLVKLGASAITIHAILSIIGILTVIIAVVKGVQFLGQKHDNTVEICDVKQALKLLEKNKNFPNKISEYSIPVKAIFDGNKSVGIAQIIQNAHRESMSDKNSLLNFTLSINKEIPNARVPCSKHLEDALTNNTLSNKALMVGPSRTGKTFFGNIIAGQRPGKNVIVKINANELFQGNLLDSNARNGFEAIIKQIKDKGFTPIVILDEVDKIPGSSSKESFEQGMLLIDNLETVYGTANYSAKFKEHLDATKDKNQGQNTRALFLNRLINGALIEFKSLNKGDASTLIQGRISESSRSDLTNDDKQNMSLRVKSCLEDKEYNMEEVAAESSRYINDYLYRRSNIEHMQDVIFSLDGLSKHNEKYPIAVNKKQSSEYFKEQTQELQTFCKEMKATSGGKFLELLSDSKEIIIQENESVNNGLQSLFGEILSNDIFKKPMVIEEGESYALKVEERNLSAWKFIATKREKWGDLKSGLLDGLKEERLLAIEGSTGKRIDRKAVAKVEEYIATLSGKEGNDFGRDFYEGMFKPDNVVPSKIKVDNQQFAQHIILKAYLPKLQEYCTAVLNDRLTNLKEKFNDNTFVADFMKQEDVQYALHDVSSKGINNTLDKLLLQFDQHLAETVMKVRETN